MEGKEIRSIISNDRERRDKIILSKKYYENENDIRVSGVVPADNEKDPLRNADNRISHNFHQLLVDEKASYMFTYPVLFDLENKEELNNKVADTLGDDFEGIAKDLCIESSNAGVSYIHHWIDEESKKFEYALVPTEQIIAKYSNNLKKNLIGIYRYYEVAENETVFTMFENWTKDSFDTYKIKGGLYAPDYKITEEINVIHTLGEVPFIEFKNNSIMKNDLSKYKDLIDLYDKVMSGFANDLEDIQQIIYILENYGGEDLKEFLGDLKRYKAIKSESGQDGGGGVKTLQIEIPVEARRIILEILKKQIYESGQGLQQDVEGAGNASGVALKFFYRKLELKSGNLETEFKKSFSKLVRRILIYLKADDKSKITQIYTRNMISNELEIAQIAQASAGLIPKKLILKNHPWVDDPEVALKMLEEEQEQSLENYNIPNESVDE